MKTNPQSLTHEGIAACARQLWQAAGCPSGRDEEFWLHAEQQLKNEVSPPALPTSTPPAIQESPAHTVPPVLREVVQPVARPKASSPSRKRSAG